MPPEIEELRHTYGNRWKEIQQAHADEIGGLGIGGGSTEWPQDQTATLRSGYRSFDYLDGDTLVVETRRYKDGHEIAIVDAFVFKAST